MLSPRLMLILTFSMVDMDILDMPDTTDILMPTDILTMASVLLMLSPRLMLTPTFCMEDMDILDMLDTTDTPMVAMPTECVHLLHPCVCHLFHRLVPGHHLCNLVICLLVGGHLLGCSLSRLQDRQMGQAAFVKEGDLFKQRNCLRHG